MFSFEDAATSSNPKKLLFEYSKYINLLFVTLSSISCRHVRFSKVHRQTTSILCLQVVGYNLKVSSVAFNFFDLTCIVTGVLFQVSNNPDLLSQGFR